MTMKMVIPTFELAYTHAKIPAVGFGSGSKHRIKKWTNETGDEVDRDIVEILKTALNKGFNHIDAAETYTTRTEVATAIKECNIKRSDLWITDKFDQGWPAYDRKSPSPTGPRESILKGLKIFGMEYYDLFLIHAQFFDKKYVDLSITEAWKQLEECYEEGLVKNIGVSNFDVEHIEEIMKIAKYKPQVNQIEYHLYLQNQTPGIKDYCNKNNILLEAYCPLSPIIESRIKDDKHPLKPIITELCEKYKVSPNIIVLRWVYQSGVIPITTSSNSDRMKETFDMFKFELSDEDFKKLETVGNSYHFRNYFPEYFGK